MDYRKIIGFGKSSFVVSLPKNWLAKNKLVKGDLVFLEEVDNNLLLLPKKVNIRKELKSIELDISKKDIRDINRRIVSAYIQNYNLIHIFGKGLKAKSKEIKDTIQNLMALEIMEETSEKIVAKDFLKMEELSVIDLLRRMDIITRAMFLDMLKVFDEPDEVESIYWRDMDVNRLTFLLHRLVQFYFDNPSIANEKGFTNKKIMTTSTVIRNVERFADNVKRIVKLLARVKLSKKNKEKFLEILKEVFVLYEGTMKSYYKCDIELAFSLAEDKRALMKKMRVFFDEVSSIKWAPTIIEKIKDSISCCHSMSRDVYH